MALIIPNAPPTRHIVGDMALRFFNVSGASGSTLATGMTNILFIGVQPGSLITGVTVANIPSGNILTLNSSAPMVNEVVMVWARVG